MIKITQKTSFRRIFLITLPFFITIIIFLIFYYFGIFRSISNTINDIHRYGFENILLKKKVCLKEGDAWPYSDQQKLDCCSGLRKITLHGVTDHCSGSLTTSYTCSPCGNGICDKYEHYCNCREDCTEEESLKKAEYQEYVNSKSF